MAVFNFFCEITKILAHLSLDWLGFCYCCYISVSFGSSIGLVARIIPSMQGIKCNCLVLFGACWIFWVLFYIHGSVLAFRWIDCDEDPIIASIAAVLHWTPLVYQTGCSIYISTAGTPLVTFVKITLFTTTSTYIQITYRIYVNACTITTFTKNNFYQNHLQIRKGKNPPNWRPPGIKLTYCTWARVTRSATEKYLKNFARNL